jgi:tRNA threonylcarbamoyladenosine biosynthesis protein TsaB
MSDLLLALETSTRIGQVAVVQRDGRTLAARSSEVSTHSETVLPLIDAVLGEVGCAVSDLAAIACGAGPGSFTGLRIGLATAKGLCFAGDKPLVLVSSLAALAAEVAKGRLAIACLDARKGEVFVAAYIGDRMVVAEQAMKPAALAAFVDELRVTQGADGSPKLGIELVGDAAARYPELATAGSWLDRTPAAAAVGRLGWARLLRGERDDLDAASPLYVRSPDITTKRKSP